MSQTSLEQVKIPTSDDAAPLIFNALDLFLILTVREAHLAVLLGTSVQPTVSMGEFSTFAVRLDEKFDSDEQTWVSPDDDLHLNCGEYSIVHAAAIRI